MKTSPKTDQLRVEKRSVNDISAVLSLINDAYGDLPEFKPFTADDFAAVEEPNLFVGFIGEKMVSVIYGDMIEGDKGRIRWACIHQDFRGECHTLSAMQKCIGALKAKGAKQIRVDGWLDSPYRQLLAHLDSQTTQFEHNHLIMRLDMRQYRPQSIDIETPYVLRTFQEGDEVTWATVKNKVFEGESRPEDFWTQTFLDVNMESDFDPTGFFFAEVDGQPVGISAGIVLHNRKKIAGNFPGGIGWTGVCEAHRGKGIGRVLITHAVNYLHGRNIAVTELGTQFYRTAAVNLYESLGFQIHIAYFTLG